MINYDCDGALRGLSDTMSVIVRHDDAWCGFKEASAPHAEYADSRRLMD